MFQNVTLSNKTERYGTVKRSVFRNLFLSMLTFGMFIGIIFPPFAAIVLDTDRALSPIFIAMCILAGFIVGLVNFQLFRVVVSRELDRVQLGMQHVLERVARSESLGDRCDEKCKLEVKSADIIGDIAIMFNKMTEAISRRLALESATRSITESLMSSVELKDVSEAILDSMSRIMGAKGGVLYGDTGQAMELLADFGIDKTDRIRHVEEGQGPIKHALNTGEILTLSTQDDGLDWIIQSSPLGQFIPKSMLIIPLRAKQTPVGLVALACSVDKPSSEQVDILEALRSYGAPHLQNTILHRKITDLAAIDDLTLILNRRFGLRRLREEFSRSVRHGVPVSVLMLDVDHFKTFNDTFGHDAGDAVLKMVAKTIDSNVRAGDMVCRYGGEEFMVVAPDTGLKSGAAFGERIRRLIETSQVQFGQRKLSVTISIGVATWPISRASVSEELITAADLALYAAKDAGRNQIAAHRGDQILPLAMLETKDIHGSGDDKE